MKSFWSNYIGDQASGNVNISGLRVRSVWHSDAPDDQYVWMPVLVRLASSFVASADGIDLDALGCTAQLLPCTDVHLIPLVDKCCPPSPPFCMVAETRCAILPVPALLG